MITRREFLKSIVAVTAVTVPVAGAIAATVKEVPAVLPEPQRCTAVLLKDEIGGYNWYRVGIPTPDQLCKMLSEHGWNHLDWLLRPMSNSNAIVLWDKDGVPEVHGMGNEGISKDEAANINNYANKLLSLPLTSPEDFVAVMSAKG